MKIQFQWIIALLIASLLIIGASGCQKTAEQAQPQQEVKTSGNIVKIIDFSFQPTEITINAGESVTWINQQDVVHTASADDITWSVKMIGGQNMTKKFDAAGEYPYHCAIHPSMKGKVIVK